jgi:hypothetical protein
MKHILLKYPTRQRPEKFMSNLNSYLNKASGKHKITVIISMDTDDALLNNEHVRQFLESKNTDNVIVSFFYGESRGKIHAINRDIPNSSWDILISTADDMEPVENNWDDIIVNDMFSFFPDLKGSLNYDTDPRLDHKGPEGYKTLITLPIIGRTLYNLFGYVYHPDYKSEWCDNEQTEVFESLGVLKHIKRRPIIHKWFENQDSLMARNMQIGSNYDKQMYMNRKSSGFPTITQK